MHENSPDKKRMFHPGLVVGWAVVVGFGMKSGFGVTLGSHLQDRKKKEGMWTITPSLYFKILNTVSNHEFTKMRCLLKYWFRHNEIADPQSHSTKQDAGDMANFTINKDFRRQKFLLWQDGRLIIDNYFAGGLSCRYIFTTQSIIYIILQSDYGTCAKLAKESACDASGSNGGEIFIFTRTSSKLI